jgi:hypothetical protein
VVDDVNSIDKEASMDLDRFGYQSTHLVLSYTDERLHLPEFTRFQGMKFEVQVKTILQHAWAAIDWKLRYKNAVEAPKEFRRRLYRISALLEAADDDFSYVSDRVVKIRNEYNDSISRGDLKLSIDKDSVQAFLNDGAHVNIIEKLKSKIPEGRLEIISESDTTIELLVKTINKIGILSIEALKEAAELDMEGKSEKIKKIWDAWDVKATKSAPSTFIRLSIIYNLPKEGRVDVVQKLPFSPSFNKIVLDQLEAG